MTKPETLPNPTVEPSDDDLLLSLESRLGLRPQQELATVTPIDRDQISDEAKTKRDQARQYIDTIDGLRDIVTVDGTQGAHIPKGSGSRSGQFLSSQNLEMIAAHQDLIRESLPERQAGLSQTALDSGDQQDPAMSAETYGPRSLDDVLDDIYHSVDSPELAQKEIDLAKARSRLADLSARYSRRVTSGKDEDYIQAARDYQRLKSEVAKLIFADSLPTDTEENRAVSRLLADLHFFKEQNLLREEARNFTEGRKLWRFNHKISEFLNRGSLKWRITKGAFIGIGVGAVGLVTFGAGAAGAVGLGLGYRIGRGANASMADGIGQLTRQDREQIDETGGLLDSSQNQDDLLRSRAAIYDTRYESDSYDIKRKRRRKVMGAAAVVAAGYGAGMVAHAVIGGLHPAPSASSAPTGYHDSWPGNKASGDVSMNPSDYHDSWSSTEAPVASPHEAIPFGHDISNISEAYTIYSGEGFYQTFKDMGVPRNIWGKVLNEAGPRLQKLGEAYFDKAHGEWRIPHSGQFSREALEMIASAAADHGYTFNPIK